MRMPDGAVGLICGNFGKPCHCGAVADFECDYPIGGGRTCDARLCADHAVVVGKNRHLCQTHARAVDTAEFVLQEG
jgi:hypothetical protein